MMKNNDNKIEIDSYKSEYEILKVKVIACNCIDNQYSSLVNNCLSNTTCTIKYNLRKVKSYHVILKIHDDVQIASFYKYLHLGFNMYKKEIPNISHISTKEEEMKYINYLLDMYIRNIEMVRSLNIKLQKIYIYKNPIIYYDNVIYKQIHRGLIEINKTVIITPDY